MRLFWVFLRAVAASAALLTLTACPERIEAGGEDELEIIVPTESAAVFASGLALSADVPEARVKFTATGRWRLTTTEVKALSWLTVEPVSGEAGTVILNVTATPDTDGHEANVTIVCGDDTKAFTVSCAAKEVDHGVKAAYSDFLGYWYVEGTEHTWFYSSGGTPVTARYIINIKQDETGTGYLIEDWETAADASYAVPNYTDWTNFNGDKIYSVYRFYKARMYTDIALKAKYDADRGSLTISRQSFRTDSGTTMMFLGDTYASNGHLTQGGTDYIVCECRQYDDGSFNILPGTVDGIKVGSMGYAQYRTGWADHFNKDFALPLTMKKVENVASSIKADKSRIIQYVGTDVTLTSTLKPETADKSHITWYSSATGVATVDASGKVNSVAPGDVIIYTSADSYIDNTAIAVLPKVVYTAPQGVDLGLSVKWAPCNLGADKPQDIGGYYCWGETDVQNYYNHEHYKHFSVEQNQYIKYTGTSASSPVSLEVADDAARQKWGGTWRLPSEAEITEFIERCTRAEETLEGVKGLRFTGPNGNSIFVPYAGSCYDGARSDLGTMLCFWSSGASYSDPIASCVCYPNKYNGTSGPFVATEGRHRGLSIRPVAP